MRAVVGSVNSSKAISLSKAAPILSRFASSVASAGTRREVSAYLRRASAAFDEVVQFHRDLKDELLKRNSSNGGGDGRGEKERNSEGGEERNMKKTKSKKNRDRHVSEIEIGLDGNREEVERENGVLKRNREDSENGMGGGGGSEIHDRKKKRRKN